MGSGTVISEGLMDQMIRIIKEGGEIILSARHIGETVTAKDGKGNFVTAYDKKVQAFLFERLGELLPEAVFAGEEEESHPDVKNGYAFIIDPIDGTMNFMKGYRRSAISVGLLKEGVPCAGIVYNPYAGEVFSAIRGKGAFLNGNRIYVADEGLSEQLVLFGTSPYDQELYERTFRICYALFQKCPDIRRSGSAAIDLCDVACGRAGLYFELMLSPWDYAAGCLILAEAGGKAVTQEGWKAVYGGDEGKRKKKEDDDEQRLPALAVGDERLCKRAQVTRDQTKPPKEYSDASILLDMEHAGRQIADEEIREQMKDCALGTPATRAAIIERLIDVGYVRRSGKNLVATEKGVHLIEAVPQEIASPETTGRWERALAEIARGSDGEARFRQGIARLAAFLVENAAGAPDVAFAKEERRGKKRIPTLGVACPVCGQGKVAENSKGFYCTRFREGCKFTIWKDARAGGPMLTAKLLKLCMEKKDVRGSTGTIHYDAGQIRFEAGER